MNVGIVQGDHGPEVYIEIRYPVTRSYPLAESDSWVRDELKTPGFVRFDENHIIGKSETGVYTVYAF